MVVGVPILVEAAGALIAPWRAASVASAAPVAVSVALVSAALAESALTAPVVPEVGLSSAVMPRPRIVVAMVVEASVGQRVSAADHGALFVAVVSAVALAEGAAAAVCAAAHLFFAALIMPRSVVSVAASVATPRVAMATAVATIVATNAVNHPCCSHNIAPLIKTCAKSAAKPSFGDL